MRDAAGTVTHFVGIETDVTELYTDALESARS